jgi:thioredoxin-like negative regulator of GroEL
MSQKPINLEDKSWLKIISKTIHPLVLEFWSFRCESCRNRAPLVSKIAQDLDGQVTVCKVNVDENPRIVSYYSVSLVPCLIIVVDRQIRQRFLGDWNLADVKEAVSKLNAVTMK